MAGDMTLGTEDEEGAVTGREVVEEHVATEGWQREARRFQGRIQMVVWRHSAPRRQL